jgi:hypothetical protein
MTKVRKKSAVVDYGAQLRSLMPTDELMIPAWLGCLHWSLGQREILDRYYSETGTAPLVPAKTPLDMLIDEATGVTGAYLVGFAAWMNREIWGEEK